MSFYNVILQLHEESGLTKAKFLAQIGLRYQDMNYYKYGSPTTEPKKQKILSIEKTLGIKFIRKEEGQQIGKGEIIDYRKDDIPTSIHQLYSAPLTELARRLRAKWEEFKKSEQWGLMDEEKRKRLDADAAMVFSEIEDARDEADTTMRTLFRKLERRIIMSQVEELEDEGTTDFGNN